MKFGDIPPHFTRRKREVIRVWFTERTVARTMQACDPPYKSPSFVRSVVREYRLFLAGEH